MIGFLEFILIIFIIFWLDSRIVEFINTLKNINNTYIAINEKQNKV